ncbi:hypothetical protein PGT21_015626 [Puccinia graminis f. sp. tritici]|uniref:Hydrophobin n=1 Tax=Puccinia graminis f. sp. tritici TaxID=56615 RepID=A0A5B0NRR5_PUCGR|nr:hypothetical protein PGTUg99_020973 [Puccinia graminis f. sp. tritici]KAA1090850.1 hypothetical protein PGT21_015626 [Puccinia graminis f. sp. tritici]
MSIIQTLNLLSLATAVIVLSSLGKNAMAFNCKSPNQPTPLCAFKRSQYPGKGGSTTSYIMRDAPTTMFPGPYDCHPIHADSAWCCAKGQIQISSAVGSCFLFCIMRINEG